MVDYGISHSFDDETLEAKARWFLQKPMAERLRSAFESIIFLQRMKKFVEPPDDRSVFTTVRVLEPKKAD